MRLFPALALVLLTASPVEDAAARVMRRDFTGAETLLGTDPSSIYVRACVALEQGKLKEAAVLAKSLVQAVPESVEGLVLVELVARRAARPKERWTDALLFAWQAAGQPDTGARKLLARAKVEREVPIRAGMPDELLVRASWRKSIGPELLDLALAESVRVDAPAAVLWTAAAVLLDEGVPAARREEATAAGKKVLERLAPEDAYAAVGALLIGTPDNAPLTANELAALEALLRRPKFNLPVRTVFKGVQAAFQKIDEPQADSRAYVASSSDFVAAVWSKLKLRSDATASPRAIALVRDAGRKMGEGPSLVDAMVGLALERSGDADKEMKTRSDAVRALNNADDTPWQFEWPLPSLMHDHFERVAEDELAYRRALAGPPTQDLLVQTQAPMGTVFSATMERLDGTVVWRWSRRLHEDQRYVFLKVLAGKKMVLRISATPPHGTPCHATARLIGGDDMRFIYLRRTNGECRLTDDRSYEWPGALPAGDFPPYAPPLIHGDEPKPSKE